MWVFGIKDNNVISVLAASLLFHRTGPFAKGVGEGGGGDKANEKKNNHCEMFLGLSHFRPQKF